MSVTGQQSLLPSSRGRSQTRSRNSLAIQVDLSSDSSTSSDTCRVPSLKHIGKQLYKYTVGSTRCASMCYRRRRGYEEIHSSTSSSSSSSSSTEDEAEVRMLRKKEEKDIRQKLKFHFMNPFQKWKYDRRRRFPFKLVLQAVTVVLVTAQVILFGDKKALLTNFILGNTKTIEHVFLDTTTLDPDDMTVYTMDELYEQLSTGVKAYYNIKRIAVAPYDYYNDSDEAVPTLTIGYEEYDRASLDPSEEKFHFSQTTHWTYFDVYGNGGNATCVKQLHGNCSVKGQIAHYINASNLARIKVIKLPFSLSTFYVDQSETQYVSCVKLDVNISFTNTLLQGNIPIDVVVDVHFDQCDSNNINHNQFVSAVFKEYVVLDIIVFLVLLVYTILCVRSILGTFKLAHVTQVFFNRFYNKKLTWRQKWALQNLWFYGVVIGNGLNLIGTILKIIVAFKIILSIPLEDATTLILGLGVFFQWCGLLRFFSYFDTYNILLLTLKLSLPSVIRFAVCAGILYIAFLFCGWLVLGPYHEKFVDLSVTSECLFSLLNGDDMFATYKEMPQTSPAIWVFSKVYLYLFISLFIYVVLSVFIGLISDTYETLNEHWYMRSKGFLHEFALGGMAGWRKRRKALKRMNPTFQEVQEVQTREGFILVDQADGAEQGEDNSNHDDDSHSEGTDGGYRSDQGTPALERMDSPFVQGTGSINTPKQRHTSRPRLGPLFTMKESQGEEKDDFMSLTSISPVSLSPRMTQSLPTTRGSDLTSDGEEEGAVGTKKV